jgi:2-haloacid dehalogenase
MRPGVFGASVTLTNWARWRILQPNQILIGGVVSEVDAPRFIVSARRPVMTRTKLALKSIGARPVKPAARIKNIKAFAFDAYGTLFDVFSVTAFCEQLFPGKGNALAQLWRVKQLQYSLLRSLMGRHKDFWQLTEDGLVYASKSLKLDLTPEKRKRLMEAYFSLAAFPDVKPGLDALKKHGFKLAILSNGESRMLEAAAKSAGIYDLLDRIISIEEVKIFKPSPRVYNLGPERMNVSNAELGFVSSNSWDINGAASAGLMTFWIQRSAGEPPEELGFSSDRVVSAITDLAPLVRG